MATPITFTSITPNLPYAQLSDVLALIGNVGSIADGTITPAQIAKAISAASSFIDNSTNRFFSPRRIISYIDGNGQGRLQLPIRPIINLNSVSIYVAYPLAISLWASDWNMRIDRGSGTLSFPLGSWMPTLAPFASFFLEGSENIIVDATYGTSRIAYGEVLSSVDNIHYSFANQTAVQYSTISTATDQTPPAIYPIVYLNGVPIINTVYQLESNAAVYSQNIWQVATDNIAYTLTTSASGITGVAFNGIVPNNTVVTVDYPYWIIEPEIVDITAKKACITLLSGIATDGGFDDTIYQGSVENNFGNARTRYNDTLGKWGHQMTLWQTEIAAGIATHKKLMLPYGLSRNGVYI